MTASKQTTQSILITIDVEDWFQVENFKTYIPFSTWDSRELRVEKNVQKILDLFDSISARVSSITASKINRTGKTPKVRATFFVLGWIAEKVPNLVREIGARGHEVASHGYNHQLSGSIKRSDLKQDLVKSKKLLEDITGSPIYGYRAPSFSIDNDVLKIIEDCGYRYDSSYNSFGLHDRYGKVNLNGHPKRGIAYKLSNTFYELPISNLILTSKLIQGSKIKINNLQIPLGGGGYFRLIPFYFFKLGVKSILKNESTYVFYLHPWELDPHQPRIRQAKLSYRFRHYNNLNRTENKLKKMFREFEHCRFASCQEYIA